MQPFDKLRVARQNRLVGLAAPVITAIYLFTILFSGASFAYAQEEKTYYFLNDHLGSTDVILDDQGNAVERADYLPFGSDRVRVTENTAPETDYGFTGKEMDEESGLYYYGARYYDPVIGRFISQDPWEGDLTDPQTLNKYSYTVNNPVNNVDPSGNIFESVWDAANVAFNVGAMVKNEVEILKDIAKYTYGYITKNKELKEQAVQNFDQNIQNLKIALTDFGADSVAIVIPFVPAGTTKAKRIYDKSKNAYNVAKSGGRHAGFLKNYLTKTKEQIEKGIKNFNKRIQEHIKKIKNPSKNADKWKGMDYREKQGLIKRWGKDMNKAKEEKSILKKILKERGN